MAMKLLLNLVRHASDPEGVQVMVDSGERGPHPVWFKLYCDDELVTESKGITFYCTKPGEYYVEGVNNDGSKAKTQKLEITAGMIAASRNPPPTAQPMTPGGKRP